mmetsp:Transcript_10720/g.32762  ORF Transcript_10720/g.32762 Transcript_10720/m.32762 type:complete len:323 (-) Transcript_10720:113-1081(-)
MASALVTIIVFSFASSSPSARQLQLLALLPRLQVVVEEVKIKAGLDKAREPHDPGRVVRLGRISVDPVQDVERPVEAEQEHVVSGQVVHILRPLQQHELGQDGHGLQVDGKRPQDLEEGEPSVDDQGEDGARHDQEEVPEGIVVLVIRLLHSPVPLHVPDDHRAGGYVNHLEDGVVERVKVPEEVQVPRDENSEVELLRLQRDPGARLCGVDLEQEHKDREQVQDIRGDPEDVHPVVSLSVSRDSIQMGCPQPPRSPISTVGCAYVYVSGPPSPLAHGSSDPRQSQLAFPVVWCFSTALAARGLLRGEINKKAARATLGVRR